MCYSSYNKINNLKNRAATIVNNRNKLVSPTVDWCALPIYFADKRAKATNAFALAYYGISLYLSVSFYIVMGNRGFKSFKIIMI